MPGSAVGATRFVVGAFTGMLLLAGCSVYDESLLEPMAGSGGSTGLGGGGGSTTDAVEGTGSGGDTTNSATSTDVSVSGGTSSSGGSVASSVSSSVGAGGSGGSGGGGNGGNGGIGAGGSGGTGGVSSTTSSGGSTTTGSSGCSETDCCPNDPDKTLPGECGCDVPETDSDDDGAPDCIDTCPADPNKTEPGECGCGVLDADSSAAAGCLTLKNGLVHRYSFDDTGDAASDSRGTADASIVGTLLDGSGALELVDGGSEQYAELPAGILSELTSATVEAWFTWGGSSSWQRLFDFGSSDQGAGQRGDGVTYLFFTTQGSGSATPRAIFADDGFSSEIICTGSDSLESGTPYHVAVSIDSVNDTITLYVDGMLQSAKAFSATLDSLDDVNNWLGRSQYAADAQFVGSIEEFRIYDVALTRPQVDLSFASGPEPAFLDD